MRVQYRYLSYSLVGAPTVRESITAALIREFLIKRCGCQFDEEMRQPIHEQVHQPAALVGGSGAWVSEAGVSADQVPGPSDAHPATVDGFEPSRPGGAVIRQLRVDQLRKERKAQAGFNLVGMLAGLCEDLGIQIGCHAIPVTHAQ